MTDKPLSKLAEVHVNLATPAQTEAVKEAAASVCSNCGKPIVGRKANAVFCSTCACERETSFTIERGLRRWARIMADPLWHHRRNEQKRLWEFDRRLDDVGFRNHERARLRKWRRRQRRIAATKKLCAECGYVMPLKIVNGRLSNRRLHDECLIQRRRGRVVLAWAERRGLAA